MKLTFFKLASILILLLLSSAVNAEPELKVISAELERNTLNPGESTKVTVTIKNTGDSEVYDFSFLMSLPGSDRNDFNVSGNTLVKDLKPYTGYIIETKNTSIVPGEIKIANFFINAVAPKKEEYVLGFAAGGRKGKDKILNRETIWWPNFIENNLKIFLKINMSVDYYINKSEEYLKSGNYGSAKDYARKAKEIYINSGNSDGALNSDKIILQSDELINADVAYRRAKSRMDASDSLGAMSNAEISFRIYAKMDSINSSLISERLSELEVIIGSRNKTITADNYYLEAKKYSDAGDYVKAKEKAEIAKAIYLEQNDSESASECDLIINKSEMYVSRDSTILKVGGGILAIIIIFIIHYFYRKSKESRPFYPSDLTIESAKKIQIQSSGFSEVSDYHKIPDEAIDPYTGESIHDLIALGKTIVKCNDCGAYYNREILEYYKMNCARFGCRNSTI